MKILYTEFEKYEGLGIITPAITPMLFSYADHGEGVHKAAIYRAEYTFGQYIRRLKEGVEMTCIDKNDYKKAFGLGKYRIRVFNSQSPMMMWEDFLDELPAINSIYSPQYTVFDKSPKFLYSNYKGIVKGIRVYNKGKYNKFYEMVTWDIDSKFG